MTAPQANPRILFDGLIKVFSTCRDCGLIMQVTEPGAGDTVHSHCEPKPTRVESLATGWLSAVHAKEWETVYSTEQVILEVDARPPRLLDAALLYASWGWPVFPLQPGTKEPWPGSRGFKDATTDPELIRHLWRMPDANIGLATGHLFDVIDVDPKNGGAQSLHHQLAYNKAFPDCHGIVATSSSGLHLYVEPKGCGNFAGFHPGMDYRGRGGYVVAPPSTRGPNQAWSWCANGPSPNIKGGNA